MTASPSRLALSALLVVGCALSGAAPAAAEPGAGEWVRVAGAALRLVAAAAPGPDGAASVEAAVEVRMDPGWHIYWRFPGEAGIPTEADFSASTGISTAKLRFPPPERHFDGYSTSIVYKTGVVLPVDLTLDGPAAAATLTADLRFGICSDICVPGQARLSLPLAEAGGTLQAIRIGAARLSLPQPQGESPPRVAAVAVRPPEAGAKAPVIEIDVDLTGADSATDLFAEGTPGSYNGVPRLVERTGTRARFALSADGLLADGDGGRPLALTLVEGTRAVTFATRIAAEVAPPR